MQKVAACHCVTSLPVRVYARILPTLFRARSEVSGSLFEHAKALHTHYNSIQTFCIVTSLLISLITLLAEREHVILTLGSLAMGQITGSVR